MRHIGFDESSVLGEYARIANELGLIKTAQEAVVQPGVVNFEEGTEFVAPLAPGAARNAFSAFLQEVAGNKALYGAYVKLKDWNIPPAQDPAELGETLVEEYKGVPALVGLVQKHFPQVASKKAGLHSDLSKEAGESKLYDVSGETGEDLVDAAHPGGGTRTELSHSKTDENLVETIVEQQERDVEVAHSVPKGTYAMLVDLYSKLQKMGHEKHLKVLSDAINKVATNEEVVSYALTSLADKLDAIGAKNAANRVDGILKKKIASPESENAVKQLEKEMINKFLGALATDPKAKNWTGSQAVYNQIKNTTTWADARKVLQQAATEQPQLASAYSAGMAAVAPYMSSYSVLKQQSMAPQQNPDADGNGVPDSLQRPSEVDPNEPELVSKPVAKKWDPLNRLKNAQYLRRRFNKALRDLPEHHSDAIPNFDADEAVGKYPAQLRSEIQRARAMVRAAGGWEKFEATMDAKRSSAGKGEARPLSAPTAPQTPEDKAVVKEQAVNKMYGALSKGLRLRGYPVQDMTEEMMRMIRERSDIYDVTSQKGLQAVWNMVRQEANKSFPKKQ